MKNLQVVSDVELGPLIREEGTRSVRLAYLAWVVVCVVWGTTYLGIRIALETVPPFSMAALRWLAAGLFLAAVLWMRGERLPRVDSWGALALLGILLMGIGNGGVVWAEQSVPSGLTAVLVAAIPFWMVGVERLVHGGRELTKSRAAGLALGFGGILLLVWPELRLGEGQAFLGGVGATQLACLGWAVGSIVSRRRQPAENVLAASALQMVFAGVALGAVASLRGEWSALTFNGRTAGALVYLVTAGSIVGYSAYAYALKHLPVATVSLYAYINPVIAVALGTLLVGEPFTPRILAAGAIVLMGVVMVQRPRS